MGHPREVAIEGLVEREAELEQLTGLVDAAREGEGAIALVQGPAGIGKTLLLEATADRAVERGCQVLAARSTELEREFSFGVVRQLFDPVLRDMSADERSELLAGAAGLAEPVLTDRLTEAPSSTADPGFATLHGLFWLLSNLSTRSPLVLIVDDVHWADQQSVRFANFLIHRVRDIPVLVLLAARPRDPGGISELLVSLAADRQTRLVRLAPLSEAGTATIIKRRLGDDCDPQFTGACHVATAGNPFFLSALIEELDAEGIAPTAQAAGKVPEIGPQTVSHIVLLRLARLPQTASALASALAVLGDGAEFRHVAALSGLKEPAARAAADALTRAEIVRRAEQLEFVHPIVRAAIYNDLAPRERSDAHGRAARLLAAESAASGRVAAHLVATDPTGDPWVADQLRTAAEVSYSQGALDAAASYLHRALREPVEGEARAELLLKLSRTEQAVGPMAAIEHLTRSLELAKSPQLRSTAASELSRLLLTVDRGEEAIELVDREIAELPADARELRLSLEGDLAAVANMLGRHGVPIGERLRRLELELAGETLAERRLLAVLAYHGMGIVRAAPEAAALAELALGEGQLLDQDGLESLPLQYACYVLVNADRFELAERTYTDIIERARASGAMLAYALASGLRAISRYKRGALDGALADAHSALDIARDLPFILYYALRGVILVQMDRGELEACDQTLNALGVDRELPDNTPATALLIDRARLRLAQGRAADAVVDSEEAGRRAARWGSPIAYAWRPEAARAHRSLGNHARAVELARIELEAARFWGAPRMLGIALNTLGVVEGGEPGMAHLREAVSILETSDARLEHARALVNLGAALRRGRLANEARSPLTAGLGLAHECGATMLAKTADDELAATGIRRHRRTFLSGVDALTPTERRVAEMAADGLSNPQIAQALFVTRKTVEMHLANAYRKLDINSREQLPQALGSPIRTSPQVTVERVPPP